MSQPVIEVLQVEDNELMQLAQKMVLEEEGCKVDVASTGKEAIEFSIKKPYSLILMDIGLEDMNGFIATKEIKDKSFINNKTPIVAVTAHSEDEFKKQAVECGMVKLITKPLTAEKIRKLLEDFLITPQRSIK